MTGPAPDDDSSGDSWRQATGLFLAARDVRKELETWRDHMNRYGKPSPNLSIDNLLEYIDIRYGATVRPAIDDTLGFMNSPTTSSKFIVRQIPSPLDDGRIHEHLTIIWESSSLPSRRVVAQFDRGRRDQQISSATAEPTARLISLRSIGDVELFVPAEITPGNSYSGQEHFRALLKHATDAGSTIATSEQDRNNADKLVWLQQPPHHEQISVTSAIGPNSEKATVLERPIPTSTTPSFEPVVRQRDIRIALPDVELPRRAEEVQQRAFDEVVAWFEAFDQGWSRERRAFAPLRELSQAAFWLGNPRLATEYAHRSEMMRSLFDADQLEDENPLAAVKAALDAKSHASEVLTTKDPIWIDVFRVLGRTEIATGNFVAGGKSLSESIKRSREHREKSYKRTERAADAASAFRRGNRPLDALDVLDDYLEKDGYLYVDGEFYSEYLQSAAVVKGVTRSLSVLENYALFTSGWSENLEWSVKHELPHAVDIFNATVEVPETHEYLNYVGRQAVSLLGMTAPRDLDPELVEVLKFDTAAGTATTVERMAKAFTTAGRSDVAFELLDEACRLAKSHGLSDWMPRLFEARIELAAEIKPEVAADLLSTYMQDITLFDIVEAPQGGTFELERRSEDFLQRPSVARLATELEEREAAERAATATATETKVDMAETARTARTATRSGESADVATDAESTAGGSKNIKRSTPRKRVKPLTGTPVDQPGQTARSTGTPYLLGTNQEQQRDHSTNSSTLDGQVDEVPTADTDRTVNQPDGRIGPDHSDDRRPGQAL